jgi:hypothetical protein
MVFPILALIVLSTSIYFYINSQKKLSVVKSQHIAIKKAFAPAAIQEERLKAAKSKYHALQSDYQEKHSDLKQGERRLSLYNISVGTTDSISYTRLSKCTQPNRLEHQLEEIKYKLKSLISRKEACVCHMGNDVVVNGKKSEAKKLFNREIRLRLRCLDNEFKAASALVDWNNVNRMIERCQETFKSINSSGHIVKTFISEEYLELKIQELRLNYELNQLKKDIKESEQEEARAKREAEREENRIKLAAEKAKKNREIMEKLVAKELSKLEASSSDQRELYEAHLRELDVLREKEKRATSLAQLTRAGYVYVISNTLSFGQGICKIGMTRRVEPRDRVKELGDASVPELFDIHAFIYTEDAVKLERYLHNEFAENRVNLVNNRKEFFTVSVEEVLKKLEDYEDDIEIQRFESEQHLVCEKG